MDISKFSRQYLESLSTSDLMELSNDFGIDIPENLDRNFIIGELLEVSEEEGISEDNFNISDQTIDIPQKLPESYGKNMVRAILHNPAWAFVFWEVRKGGHDKLLLRANFFQKKEDEKSDDYYDIEIKSMCSSQYIMIPPEKKYFCIELYARKDGVFEKIDSTEKISIPTEGNEIKNIQPGQKTDFPPLVKLSGIEELLSSHYREHRQAF